LFIFFVYFLIKGESFNIGGLMIFSLIFLIWGGFTKRAIFPFRG